MDGGGSMSSEAYALPLIQVCSAATRRALLDFAIEHVQSVGIETLLARQVDERDWYTQTDLMDPTGKSDEALRQNLPVLVRFGVFDIRDPDATFKHYGVAHNDVIATLASWNGIRVTELLATSARQKIVTFFLERSDPEESYSMTAIETAADMSFYGVSDNIDALADAGLVAEVEGARGTEYTLDTDEPLHAFLYRLNEVLYEANAQRADML